MLKKKKFELKSNISTLEIFYHFLIIVFFFLFLLISNVKVIYIKENYKHNFTFTYLTNKTKYS